MEWEGVQIERLDQASIVVDLLPLQTFSSWPKLIHCSSTRASPSFYAERGRRLNPLGLGASAAGSCRLLRLMLGAGAPGGRKVGKMMANARRSDVKICVAGGG